MSLEVVFDRNDLVVFQANNPKRRRTGAWGRYERYKVATTVGQARELGATAEDLRHDARHGFAAVTPALAAGVPGMAAGALPCRDQAPEIAGHGEVEPEKEGEEQERKEQEAGRNKNSEGGPSAAEQRAPQREASGVAAEASPHAISKANEDRAPQREVSGIAAEASQRDQQLFLDLALRALEHGMAKYHLSEEELQRKNSTRAWLEWLGGHVSPELASTNSAKVLAALLLHAAWCMEWGDGLPWSKFLLKLVALTRDGAQVRQHMQAGFPFHVMRFLQLSAEDCKHVGLLHCRLLMCLASSERKGLPFAS